MSNLNEIREPQLITEYKDTRDNALVYIQVLTYNYELYIRDDNIEQKKIAKKLIWDTDTIKELLKQNSLDGAKVGEDYDQFIQIGNEKLSDSYFWQTPKTDKGFLYSMDKIKK